MQYLNGNVSKELHIQIMPLNKCDSDKYWTIRFLWSEIRCVECASFNAQKTQTTWFDDIEGIWIENTKQSTELKNRTISAQVFTRFGSFWDFSMLCW